MPGPGPSPATVLTHLGIDRRLCGEVVAAAPGRCTVELLLIDEMKADATGLVHGGFVFGAADHAAMVAVNEPHVVLGACEARFVRPSRVGETLRFEAAVEAESGRRRTVAATGWNAAGDQVFVGSFVCVVLARPALEPPPEGPTAAAG